MDLDPEDAEVFGLAVAEDGGRAAGDGVHGAEAFAEFFFGEGEGDLREDGTEDFVEVVVAGEDGEIAAGDVVGGILAAFAGNDNLALVGEDDFDFEGGVEFAGRVVAGGDDATGLGEEAIAAGGGFVFSDDAEVSGAATEQAEAEQESE